jgi:hypothetical protein
MQLVAEPEGEVDSSHASFLHATLGRIGGPFATTNATKTCIRFSILRPTTVWPSAPDATPPDQYYWRITPFMLPAYTIIPGTFGGSYTFTGAVPRDDTTMIGITATWNTEHDIPRRPFVDVDSGYVPLQNKANDYLIDREAQKTVSYTGIKGVRVQDLAVQEDQRGPISDRTTEHLGASDLPSCHSAALHRQAGAPAGVEPATIHPVGVPRAIAGPLADRHVPWQELIKPTPAG